MISIGWDWIVIGFEIECKLMEVGKMKLWKEKDYVIKLIKGV